MEECIASQTQSELNTQCGKQEDSSLLKLPAASLENSDSFASISSDSSVDLNLENKRIDRVDPEGESGLEDRTNEWKTSISVIPVSSGENSDIPWSDGHKDERHESPAIKDNCNDSTFGIPEEETKVPRLFEDATDAEIWIPPPAANEDIAYNLEDDDEECGDGEWGISSSLSGFGDDSRSYCFKEEEKKAMEEVRNGKFKVLLGHFLKTAGIVDFENEEESWVNIVSALAWEAALYVNPRAAETNVMDPATYVKVKCVATGSRSQSELIKGLVFKKHAAHKRMPTRYMKPRILLIQGMLESSGLSSFNSMIPPNKENLQKDSMGQDMKSFIENLKESHPDVVFVEKSAPRDFLEAVLNMGVTLVADMKLHRLERIAHFTGSPIFSGDVILGQKLKQCDMLYFEKFVEEHAQAVEGGKKPSKTLMFLVGCSSNQGCTILLKGSHSEELKKIKCVIQYAVLIAYHFILETSFLINQQVMFSTIVSDGVATTGGRDICHINPRVPHSVKNVIETVSGDGTNLPVSSVVEEEHLVESSVLSTALNSMTVGSDSYCSSSSLETDPPLIPALANQPIDIPITGSASQESLLLDQATPKSIQSHGVDILVSNVSHEAKGLESTAKSSITPTSVAPVHYGQEPSDHSDEKLHDADNNSQPLFSSNETTSDVQKTVSNREGCNGRRGAISTMLDSERILVLMSSRNASRGTICEQIHFSNIKFYKNFDVPLGRFLRENLFNQNVPCKACGELPQAHFYYYAHHNKQLTIRVKQIPGEKTLTGASEGRLWMWSRCGKCKNEKEGNTSSTKRVLLSKAARCLSFGKFLELGFRNHSSLNRISNCGHSLHRDFLHFFGFGNMVAMFKYSTAVTYFVSVPTQMLEFNNSIKKEWLQKETENVYKRAISLFTEISNYLKKVEHMFSSSSLSLNSSVKEFSDIEKMLKAEKKEFEENIQNTCIKNAESVRKHLRLNLVRWELLLAACIWNRRLQLLLSIGSLASRASINSIMVQEKPNADQCAAEESKAASPAAHTVSVSQIDVKTQLEYVPDHSESLTEEFQFKPQQDETSPTIIDGIPIPIMETSHDTKDPTDSITGHSKDDVNQTENTLTSDQVLRDIPIVEALGDNKLTACKSFPEKDRSAPSPTVVDLQGEQIWNPLSEIREKCMIDLGNKGQLLRFQGSLGYSLQYPEHLGTLTQIISEEGSRMHIPLCNNEYLLSDYEGEVSSIIACALAMMEDIPQEAKNLSKHNDNDDAQSVRSAESTDESAILARAASEPSPSSSTPIQSDVHHQSSFSLVQSRFSSFDGLNLLDSLVSFGALHPVIALGMDKLAGKGKYSVVCVHANEFRNLRKRCCPSEIDYIASLSRCKAWDAKGGKSKSLFAKTLDDRLIIKEIKKTEFDSFIKFAAAYFNHMEQSFESGNQTCLAKILGIYQVTTRQPKSGKEIKQDLMVMENLSFGRNITRQYDLKGALHARFTENTDDSEDVLLDQNFVNDINTSPFYVVQKAKRILQRAVWNDTTFLNSINVMDYSLLVGVDRDRKELVCGIIDYLRQYTWDKQLETWVKSSLVLKSTQPTVISPREYKKRFRKFMDTHFLTVPDCWRSHKSSVPCKLCGVGDHHPSQPRHEAKDECENVPPVLQPRHETKEECENVPPVS